MLQWRENRRALQGTPSYLYLYCDRNINSIKVTEMFGCIPSCWCSEVDMLKVTVGMEGTSTVSLLPPRQRPRLDLVSIKSEENIPNQ